MKKLFKEIFLSNKKITICTIALFVLVILVAVFALGTSRGTVSPETSEKYGSYAKDSNKKFDEKKVKYYINYQDYFDTTNKYSLGVDGNKNYKLIYSKYEGNGSNKHDSYYFNGTLSEKDFDSFIDIMGRMPSFLEGIKSDENYDFYYNYQDISEQNENGNRFLKAILQEFINCTVYADENRISNFDEIIKVMIKFTEKPETDLDAELVFYDKGVIVEPAPVEDSEQASQDGEKASTDKEQVNKNDLKSNIPLATGVKSDVARLDRIVIDFKDNCSDEDVIAVLVKIDSGILFRYEQGNKYVVTIKECESVEKVQEACKKIKAENDLVENAEVCYE